MKTIKYELAKKLHNTGVRIESEKYYSSYKGENDFIICDKEQTCTDEYDYFPAPNCEEVINFLPAHYIKKTVFIDDNGTIQLSGYEIFIGEWKSNMTKQLIFSLEKALEYLLDNGYIGTEKK